MRLSAFRPDMARNGLVDLLDFGASRPTPAPRIAHYQAPHCAFNAMRAAVRLHNAASDEAWELFC